MNDKLKRTNNEFEYKSEEESKRNYEFIQNNFTELKKNDRKKEERIKELENEKTVIMDDNSNTITQMNQKYDSEMKKYKDEINKLLKENNILNQKYVQIEKKLKELGDVKNENEGYRLKVNELKNSNKKYQKKINDLEKSINSGSNFSNDIKICLEFY